MSSRNQRGHRQESNFSRRGRDESPNQWTAYGRSDSDRFEDRDYRGGRSSDSSRDYETSRDTRSRENQDRYSSSMRGDERQHQMNRYPHSYSEYENGRDMEGRRFGAHEGNSYINDRSHEDDSGSRELYRPSFDDSSRSSSPFSGGGYSSQNPSTQWGSSMNGADRSDRSYGSSSERSFSGRGPKGFKRSDDRIKEEVCELLTRDHAIDAEDIDVEVKEGEVTLTGSVPERRMKHMAEDCVERALGVKDVINNIRVKRESSSTTSSDTNTTSLTGDRTTTGKKSASGSSTSTSNSNH